MSRYYYWVGHTLSGDGIDCGNTHALSNKISELEANYGRIIELHQPFPDVTGFTTYNAYRIAFIGWDFYNSMNTPDEAISQWTEGAW
jgi:hypothetical protein